MFFTRISFFTLLYLFLAYQCDSGFFCRSKYIGDLFWHNGTISNYDLSEICLSAGIGAIAGAVGESADVSGIKPVSNQTIKRISNAMNYQTFGNRVNEISKAVTYFYKSSNKLVCREILHGIYKSNGVDIANKIISETELAESVKEELRVMHYDC